MELGGGWLLNFRLLWTHRFVGLVGFGAAEDSVRWDGSSGNSFRDSEAFWWLSVGEVEWEHIVGVCVLVTELGVWEKADWIELLEVVQGVVLALSLWKM